MTESTAELVTITPEEAARILELENVNNRALRKSHVSRLANAMKAGHWVVNGETVIHNDKYLLDGQHRLAACVLADVPFTTWVIRNVSSDAMPSIDKGLARTLGDSFSWAGHKNGPNAAAVARRLYALEQGLSLRSTQNTAQVDDFVLLEYMEKNAEPIQFGVRVAQRVLKAIGLSRTSWALPAAWIVMAGNSPADVEAFLVRVADGTGLDRGDPRWALREWANRKARERRRLRGDESLLAVVKVWNAWVCGDEMKVLKVLPSEALPEVVVL